ncbi:alkane 1-monooxygenase [Alcanivorax sp. PA15-N-34]|uniref:Alkane 1-monooxygenase n=2 Tax=Alcanivorax sediminis TaxID=2663008 RepID=A0A6N7LRC0_9GAMM|nr:alkane 1-monooxygenase [Alcanivorax sediminis]
MSKAGVFIGPSGEEYRDRKRPLWMVSLLVPGSVFLGPVLYFATGEALTLWLPLVFYYLIIPLLDMLVGEDQSNPPEEVVPQLEADAYYRYMTYALVPILIGAYLFGMWFVGTHALPFHGWLAMVLLTGTICGAAGINLGHELGHKKTPLERWLAKIVLAPLGYGHFPIEHNKGHHRDVATPEDPASSRMGETIWGFALREIPGAFFRAWELEAERLKKQGQPVWSLHNEILQPALISIALWGSIIALLGWQMVPFIAAVTLWSYLQLTSANYVEHYGLLRQKLPDGRYERTQPHHSWNSNHMFSNWASFHLQRHSDHHAHPARRYQSLRHFDNLPTLPNGYFGMFLISYFPPLWFRVMDRKLLEHADNRASNINFHPRKKDRLIRKYQIQP